MLPRMTLEGMALRQRNIDKILMEYKKKQINEK